MDFVQRAGLRPLRFRAQDSNLRFWVQRPVSCRLDDPGMSCDLRAAVGPEGFEPSPHRLRAECAPITPRTRCLAPPRCRRRGTQGIRTLISRVKSPVPYRWANVPSCDRCCFRFIRVLLSPDASKATEEHPRRPSWLHMDDALVATGRFLRRFGSASRGEAQDTGVLSSSRMQRTDPWHWTERSLGDALRTTMSNHVLKRSLRCSVGEFDAVGGAVCAKGLAPRVSAGASPSSHKRRRPPGFP